MTRLGIRKFSRAIVPSQLGLLALLCFGTPLIAQAPAVSQLPSPSAPSVMLPTITTVLYVNPATGVDQAASGKTVAAPYRTITFALQQATSGTAIQLAPGTYTQQSGEQFPLVLKPGVVLRGDENSKGQGILIQGGGATLSRAFAQQNVTIRAANDSAILGVTVTNTNTRGTGIWVEDADATISNNTFTNNNREGVFAVGNSSPLVSDNVFVKNSGNGMSVAGGARGQIKNNVFNNTGFGLALGGESIPRLEGNQITQNTAGIYMSGNTRPILRNNVITDSQGDGIVARDGAFPDLGTSDSLGNNTIRNNGRDAKLKGVDVNNTTSNVFQAIGNNIDPKKIAGRINFTAGGTNTAFSDIQGHWAQQYIQALAGQNIITGFPDGTFKPNDPVTRAQFAAIVLKAFAPAAKNPAVNFSDVSSKYWGFAAIQSASRGGFMTGFPGGTFKPEQRIPKVQALVALSNGLEFGAGDPSLLSRFQDAASIPSWAKSPIAAATQRQIVVNYPTVGQLSPERDATRAEVAAFIYQALVSAGKAQAIPSPYVVGAAR
jgi:parallel beta-helix repeat protein